MKLQVETHSGKQLESEVEGYDTVAMNERLKDNSIYTIAIGDTIFSRIDVKLITPIRGVG
ncbi:hypothetical protein [Ectobacillus panaciterrae]|uniref:hypothetical protein n=1 Tax=Ectobacillus panaciterrae TaxID=363872 RepID=UPI00041EBC2D|nr:hypothetical protein [Ectobacillus panaciterrae]